MTEGIKPSGGSLLKRWSRLKAEAREKEKAPTGAANAQAMPAGVDAGVVVATSRATGPSAGAAEAPSDVASTNGANPLPAVESLTIDSDFSPFLKPKVDEALKRRALKQLFRDPHFNVMDGLDVYIDDYTKPDPIPPDMIRELVQGRYIFNPPPTRVNAQGHVEDVPPEELAALERNAQAGTPDDTGTGASSQLPAPETDATRPSQLAARELDPPLAAEPPPREVATANRQTAVDSASAPGGDADESGKATR